MNVTSSGIVNGVIQPQYGGHVAQFNENGIPIYSLSFMVENAPQGTWIYTKKVNTIMKIYYNKVNTKRKYLHDNTK